MRMFLALVASALAVGSAWAAAPAPHHTDAPLHAVQFVDRNEGWAAGANGTMWHTIDAGTTWERQPTGTQATLTAVHFLTPYTGWAVGREERPYGAGSLGVVLVTRDGGLKWTRLTSGSLPGLHSVTFFDEANGIVAGDGSDPYPTGLFTTQDGGKTWKPIAGPRGPGWRAAAFSDRQTGALVGAWGRLATLRNGVLGAANVDTLGGRSLAAVKINGPRAVAVGEGGLVLTSSSSAGVRWGYAQLPLPPEAQTACDFRSVALLDQHVWVVGRPGSIVLHSADHGQTWEVQTTGQSLPLHAVSFADHEHGWAVGELGTILATQDGGKTWKAVQQGGQRLALLAAHARPEGLPTGTFASLGAGDGYLAGGLCLTSPDSVAERPQAAQESQRLALATRLAGGAAAESLWQFPRPAHLATDDPAALITAWDSRHGGRAGDELLRQLVLALRVWRPSVVVTDSNGLSMESLQEAYRRAADPSAFPEQIRDLHLEAWSVSKLYADSGTRADAPVRLDLSNFHPVLDSTPADLASAALAVLTTEPGEPIEQVGYRPLAGRLPEGNQHTALFMGIDLAPGGTARRKVTPPTLTQADADAVAERTKAAQAQRALGLLITDKNGVGALAKPDALLAQVTPMLAKMPDDQAAVAAHALARQCVRSGQWAMAREAFLLMVDRYPAHPLAADAYRWLVRYQASSEARRRHDMGQFMLVGETSYRPTAPPQPTLDQDVTIQSPAPELTQVRHLMYLSDNGTARRWYEGSLEIEPRLAGFGAIYVHDPMVQFPLQAARRTLGRFDDATQWYTGFLAKSATPSNRMADAWREAAAQEVWLANRTGPSPRPLTTCRMTTMRPFLDGRLEDECWQGLQPMTLRDATGETASDSPTQAYLAYDKDFLYVAVRCQHPKRQQVPRATKRTRDEDLRAHDRVELLLDLDRDYQTYFRLQIDQRGCLAEDCWGDRTWNPRWFVAVASDETGWTAEAAIPISELVSEAPAFHTTWACNISRVLPGRGVQGWSLPAGVEPRPEGMGSMVFTEGGSNDTAKK
jgi:photosystem II stability/assembly factor-like uncharacterized protein